MILYRSARESETNAPVAQLDRVTDYESVGQGFESLPAYQKNRYPIRDDGFSYMLGGTRKDGRAKRGKKVSGGHFFSPWESPLISGRIRYGCGPKSSILHAPKSNTFGCSFFFVFGTRRFKCNSPGACGPDTPGGVSLLSENYRIQNVGATRGRPRIFLKKNPSPQGKIRRYFPSKNPKNCVFRLASKARPYDPYRDSDSLPN